MDITVQAPADRASIWDHFLMKDTTVSVAFGSGGALRQVPLQRVGRMFQTPIPDDATTVDVTVTTTFTRNNTTYPLLSIVQRFVPTRDGGVITGLTPGYWKKVVPSRADGFAKISPPLHPLLSQADATITVALEFLDITALFGDLHGDTPWFAILDLLAGTKRKLRVLAALRGTPLVWYMVVPETVFDSGDIQPNMLVFPADYGGISYVQDRMEGLTTSAHDTSFETPSETVQCGGHVLFSFLDRPIADADYDALIGPYLVLTQRYKNRPGIKPPALHHRREALGYTASGGRLTPDFWAVPFGFEDALERRRQVLLIPQPNGGDIGFAKAAGLKQIVASAVFTVYTQGSVLTYDKLDIKPLILTCYSQSGGNVFTAARNNQRDVRALVCFEPQYMNAHLESEDKSLALGKDVIPALLRSGSKVAIIARRRDGWDRKYLPAGVRVADLILLPDDANYTLLDYPDPSKPYDPARSPVLARRYSRLLRGKSDKVIDAILGSSGNVIDLASVQQEVQIEAIIADLRKRGLTDEQLVKNVFTPQLNDEQKGGYFAHNFIVASGQPGPRGETVGFFELALTKIG